MKKRYRGVIKVLCSDCRTNAMNGNRFDVSCKSCQWLKYNNINNLINFTQFLDKDYPNWIFWNLYEYVKDDKGRKLETYKNGKNREVPTSQYI